MEVLKHSSTEHSRKRARIKLIITTLDTTSSSNHRGETRGNNKLTSRSQKEEEWILRLQPSKKSSFKRWPRQKREKKERRKIYKGFRVEKTQMPKQKWCEALRVSTHAAAQPLGRLMRSAVWVLRFLIWARIKPRTLLSTLSCLMCGCTIAHTLFWWPCTALYLMYACAQLQASLTTRVVWPPIRVQYL